MKKLFLFLILIFLSTTILTAQNDCMSTFSVDEGTVLVNSSYDSNKNLVSTITYRVSETYNYPSGTRTTINFVITDKNGVAVDNGNLEASCMDGTFYMKMYNAALTPFIADVLSKDTELIGDFLDYPNRFADNTLFDNTFKMDGGEYTIRSKQDKKAYVRVRVYNRKYEEDEKITTPAGTFDASKISFTYEVTQNDETTRYKGNEWYAIDAGIVRSETYDTSDQLINYTELTTWKKK